MMSRLAALAISLTLAAPLTVAAADLAVTQTSASPSYPSGSKGTYSTEVRNLDAGAVAGVTVDIRFGALSGTINVEDIDVDSAPPEFTCGAVYADAQGWHVPCSAASLPQGYAGTIVTKPTMTGSSGNMNVCASVGPTGADPNTANNSSCTAVTVTVPQANLTVSLSGSQEGSVPNGTTVTYTSPIANEGPDAASNATFSIRFTSLNGTINVTNIMVVSKPASFTCGAPFATAQGPTVNCTAATVPAGFSDSIVLSATITGNSGQMNVCNSFTSTTADPDPGVADCVAHTVTDAMADQSLTIVSSGAASVPSGTNSTYTISFRNDGPDAAASAVLSTVFTALSGTADFSNIQLVSKPAELTCAAPVATAQGPKIDCTAASLPNGYTGQVVFSATRTGAGNVEVCSTISAATQDPDTNGLVNGGCVTTTVTEPDPEPDPVTISLGGNTCPTATVGPGGSATTTVTISAAQGTNTTITLSSSNPAIATVPPTVTILAGQTSATFQITGVSVGSTTITATAPASVGGASVSCTANVEGRAAPEGTDIPALSPMALALTAVLLAVAGFVAMRT